MNKLPLGEASEYPREYAPQVLCPVARSEARDSMGVGDHLPFSGVDIWNAYELTWLGASGKPRVGIATLTVPASSPNIVESKSLKLYLGSLAMSRYGSVGDLSAIIARDVSNTAGADVNVFIQPATDATRAAIAALPGICIDDGLLREEPWHPDAGLLRVGDESVEENLHSHLLRSLCPVTGQPDTGSVLIHYSGPRIDRDSLLTYVVSFREHQDFHEACVERMFLDIKARCRSERLTVYARYNRRGGIDINPFRSDCDDDAENLRLWRQ
jgi:7-cyano-7-deazaguanine reductase